MNALAKWLLLGLFLALFVTVLSPVAPVQGQTAAAATYAVVPPYGVPTMTVLQPVKRLDTLEGKTVCGLFGGGFHFEETFPAIAQLLAKKYPTAKFIAPMDMIKDFGPKSTGTVKLGDPRGNIPSGWDAKDPNLVANMIKFYKCDAVISGNGC